MHDKVIFIWQKNPRSHKNSILHEQHNLLLQQSLCSNHVAMKPCLISVLLTSVTPTWPAELSLSSKKTLHCQRWRFLQCSLPLWQWAAVSKLRPKLPRWSRWLGPSSAAPMRLRAPEAAALMRTGSAALMPITVLPQLLTALSWPRGSRWWSWPRAISVALIRLIVAPVAAAPKPTGSAALILIQLVVLPILLIALEKLFMVKKIL